MMRLETGRMILRGFAESDLADLHEIFGDPVVMEHTEPPYDLEKTRGFLSDFCVAKRAAFAAVLKKSGKVIGYVLFREYDAPEIYQIGWIFNKDYWGRGYAFEICAALIAHAFEEMKLHKICAHATDAVKSVGMMKKLGMTQESLQRKHSRSRGGEWLDLYGYAMLREDYLKGRRENGDS
ncbi:MAG: GNAT family N-acetyltransferase [Clostridiales bacterium]|jgi:RimJ/RimL family protein N-acetyltransferase|nr:GNAT family N-acetyltransferase [Clostridiales bacterium]